MPPAGPALVFMVHGSEPKGSGLLVQFLNHHGAAGEIGFHFHLGIQGDGPDGGQYAGRLEQDVA